MAGPALPTLPNFQGQLPPDAELEPERGPLLPPEGANSAKAWRGRIDESKDLIRWHREKFFWKTNVDRVVGKGGDDKLTPTGSTLLPKDYAYSEQKRPLLFYQLPDIVCAPSRPDVTPETAQLFGQVLNELVGPTGINALPVVNEILTDVLVPAGIGAVILGYESFIHPFQPTRDVQTGTEPGMPDPMTGQPGQPTPVMRQVPNVIRERYFLERISPVDLLFDAGFRGSDWSKCSWLGRRFRMSPRAISDKYGIPIDDIKGGEDSKSPGDAESLAPDRSVQRVAGLEMIEIYARGIDYDENAVDPDEIKTIVFMEGRDEPVSYETCACQQLDEQGIIKEGSLRRAPIFPLTLHYVSDMPLPPSDCSMSRILVDELSVGRGQMWKQRDRNIPLRGLDITKVSVTVREKLRAGQWQEIIPFEGIDGGQSPIFGIAQSAYPQENFNFNNIGEKDLQECWALSGSNLGTAEQSSRTATELSMRQQGTENRMGAEQVKVELWWVSVVEALGSLVQQFADLPQYTRVVGEQGAQNIVAWTKQDIAGTYAFTIRPDSARRVDQAAERRFRTETMNLLANMEGINRMELVKWAAPSLGLDPAKIIQPPPEKPQPDPPKLTITVNTLSLSPLAPEFQNVVALLDQYGIKLPTATPPAPPPQPGVPGQPPAAPPPQPGQPPAGAPVTAAGGAPPINKHAADQTGKLPGAGQAPAPQ